MINNNMRVTGLATGMDIDEIVKNMVKAENYRVDRLKQDITLMEWQRDSYRQISNLMRGFKDEYFNYAKTSTNLRTTTAFAAFTASAMLGSVPSNAVTITPGGSATPGTHTLSNVTLAKKDIWQSSGNTTRKLTGTNNINLSGLKQGKSFDITLDGAKKTITLEKDYEGLSMSELADDVQTQINMAFGSDNITVSIDGDKLNFAAKGHTLRITDTPHTYLSTLGFNNNQANSLVGKELDFTNPFLLSGTVKVEIDGDPHDVGINIENADSIEDLIEQLNTSLAGVGITATNDGNRVKFISNNTQQEVTLLTGDANNTLSKLGFSSGAKIKKLEGTIDLKATDVGKEFDIYIGDTKYHIDFNTNFDDLASLATEINNQINAQGGPANLVVVEDDKVKFVSTSGEEVKLANSTTSIVDKLGFEPGASNVLELNKSIKDAGFANYSSPSDGEFKFVINGKEFSFSEDTALSSVINEINNSNVGVKLSYSALTDSFTLQSEQEGAANKIDFNDLNGNFLGGLLGVTNNIQQAQDAKFTLDGVETQRSTNEFTVDGVRYKLNQEVTGTDEIKIEVTADPDQVMETIKGFVEKYNALIGDINDQLSQKRDRNYMPLTEEQKKDMSEKDIELWEKKAKSGLLRSDPILQKITDGMRRALYDDVEGVGISLYDIGITTSKEYADKGKLVIDEDKLRNALKERPNEIAQLFTNKPDGTYKEKGISHRLYDIIEDNIRTTRDDNGRKGILLEKAGIEGDITEFENLINEKIKSVNKRVDDLLVRIFNKENQYYKMFTAMEKAIASMNQQSAWLAQQFGGGM